MTQDQSPDHRNEPVALNERSELERFLTAYCPSGVEPRLWLPVAEPAAELVMRAGEPRRLRVEKDIQLLGAVAAHLLDRGRPITLEEALSDTTLLSFDASLVVSDKTRENKRGIARRLQAVHRGLPWRTPRRTDGARSEALVPHSEVTRLNDVLSAARACSQQDRGAEAFTASVVAARAARNGDTDAADVDADTWARARAFARKSGWHMTRTTLRAVVTHEVLDQDEPIAVLAARTGLTRRDLDLALTGVVELPDTPDEPQRRLLRGRP